MDELKEKFHQQYPNVFYLTLDDFDGLQHYLRQRGWIEADEEIILIEKPGEGNMNMVVRVLTGRKKVIVKQARPWVQKYPQVAAPVVRTASEAAFYQLIADQPVLQEATPELVGFDSEQFMLALEDVGEGSDYTHLYQKDSSITPEEISVLVKFISRLHHIRSDEQSVAFPDNQEMKELNHEHIFNFPFQEENGFNLDDVQLGLQEISLPYKQDEELKAKITQLGQRYLATGTTLLHGDYYPGSWLKTTTGVCIIDPEFAFMGDPEFDLGVMIAHLTMAQSEPEIIQQVIEEYEQPGGYNNSLRQAFSGVEILRRIIGLAQLPLPLSLNEKRELLAQAAEWVLQYQES
ncbi:MAG: phosphotransferase [Bacteroidota bacterium]